MVKQGVKKKKEKEENVGEIKMSRVLVDPPPRTDIPAHPTVFQKMKKGVSTYIWVAISEGINLLLNENIFDT